MMYTNVAVQSMSKFGYMASIRFGVLCVGIVRVDTKIYRRVTCQHSVAVVLYLNITTFPIQQTSSPFQQTMN